MNKQLETQDTQLDVQPETSVVDTDQVASESEEEDDYQLVRDRKRRAIRPPARFGYVDLIAYALSVAEEFLDEPANYKEAIHSQTKLQWIQDMKEELDSLMKNKT